MASHSACIARTRHPYSNGQFDDCRKNQSSGSSSRNESSLLVKIKDMIRVGLDIFKKDLKREIMDLFRVELEKITGDIEAVSDRIGKLENKTEDRSSAVSPSNIESIFEELADKRSRERNIIFNNLEEVVSVHDGSLSDKDRVGGILNKILPGEPLSFKCVRLGKKRQGHTRLLTVVLPSRDVAVSILKNKFRLSGPVKIFDDQSPSQRAYLKEL